LLAGVHYPRSPSCGRSPSGDHAVWRDRPGGTLPGGCIGKSCYPPVKYPSVKYPPVHVPAVDVPAQTIPAQHVARTCFSADDGLKPSQTTVRLRHYGRIDHLFDPRQSGDYWRSAGQTSYLPDPTAPGFGDLNAAGFPKNQYVRPYVRSDGTLVSGYWRNSPTDGLPTCRIIDC
jgi:hypothetical protein